MSILRSRFNDLVETMRRFDLYQIDDEVGIALSEFDMTLNEVEKRIECARRSNQDSNSVIMSLVDSYQDLGKTEEELTYGDFETLQRGVYDVDIALNFNDKEPIENNWYSLFEEPKKEPPTELCKTPQTNEFVKDIIAKLKVIDVDGETMQYIIEQVGMEDQMLRQLIMSNPCTDTTDILEEKRILSNRGLLYK
jgi:hypothetical protein